MKKTIALLTLLAMAILVVGCSSTGGSNATAEGIYAAIKEKIVEDLKEAGYQDADFEAEELPGYIVTDLKGEDAEHVLSGLDKEEVEEGFVIKASMMLNSDQVIIIKAVPGKLPSVQEALEAELASQLELWGSYLADQAEKVQNAIITTQGGYIISITYPDAQGIEAIFNKSL